MIKEQLADMYLYFFNNYLSQNVWAQEQQINIDDAYVLLDLGKKYYNERSELIKYIDECKSARKVKITI